MATVGQLKAKIDVLRKKIAEKGAALPPERRRQLAKRLKRLQRARRVAATAEAKRHAEAAKKKGEGKGRAAESKEGKPEAKPAAGNEGAPVTVEA
jgi:hypothetical protein